jgi:RNA polymerase sigma-70 factor, ECF subfamily
VGEEARSPTIPWGDVRLEADFAGRRNGALERAYARYAGLLISVAYAVLGDRMEAEDCTHDTLLRVWNNAAAYTAGRGNLRAFLTVCVRNQAIATRRAAQRHAALERTQLPEPQSETFEVPDHLQRSQLAAAIRALPAEQWQPLRLSYFEYLTHEQIAQCLGLPLGTVKSRISLALRKLRAALPAEAS